MELIQYSAYHIWSLLPLELIISQGYHMYISTLSHLEVIASGAYHIKAYCVRNISCQEQIVSMLSISEAYCLRDKLCFVKIS